MKQKSILYNTEYLKSVKANEEKYDWAKKLKDEAVEEAEFWVQKSDEELWNMMFGHTIKRSYTVRGDGVCQECGTPVPMQSWIVDAKRNPWKVECPHCKSLFPKNDFYAYYQSGLDRSGVFRYECADETLLTVDDTPGDCESTYRKGVDDGEGCIQGWCTQKRWYYVAHYLAKGQWQQLVVGGISSLANAYLLTGEPVYAHKAAILIDRVADLLPDFDYHREGLVYEMPGDSGYVTTWHDSNQELRSIVIAYDMIFEAMDKDEELAAFLKKQAERYEVPNPKNSIADVRYNIEERILKDIQKNPRKVTLNFPGSEMLHILIDFVLGTEESCARAVKQSKEVLQKATSVDGVTGERGIGGYSGFTANVALLLLEMLSLYEPEAIRDAVAECPNIQKTFRFFTDIYYLDKYYPNVGDTTYCGGSQPYFSGVDFVKRLAGRVMPGFNMYSLLWKMYEATGDEYYLGIIRRKAKDIPVQCDMGDANAEKILRVSKQNLPKIEKNSIRLDEWQLYALTSGKGDEQNILWMHTLPFMERHGHYDTLNVGFYSRGLDLMPDAGYPPVQFGGWFTDQAKWYRKPWVHNLVVIDRQEAYDSQYETEHFSQAEIRLWEDHAPLRAVCASIPGYRGTERYERLLCMLDVGAECIVFDLFQVKGGKEHIKLQHGSFGSLSTEGFASCDTLELDDTVLLSNLSGERDVKTSVCKAKWNTEDRYGLNGGRKVKLDYYDLTDERSLYRADMWVNAGPTLEQKEDSIGALLTVRSGKNDLSSCFESIFTAYESENPILGIEKLDMMHYRLALLEEQVEIQFHWDESIWIWARLERSGKEFVIES
jgi:hypothetical protein